MKGDTFVGICHQDEAGFHINRAGRRTTVRDGRDAYAYTCAACGMTGEIKDGRFIPRGLRRS